MTVQPSIKRDFKELPLVDVSGLYSTDQAQRQKTAQALGQAAETAGFLYVTGHGVPADIIARLKSRARQYFDQPLEEKMKDWIGNSSNHSGYVPHGEEQFYGQKPDNKEAYDLGFDLAGTGVAMRRPMLGENPGLQTAILNPMFRPTMMKSLN